MGDSKTAKDRHLRSNPKQANQSKQTEPKETNTSFKGNLTRHYGLPAYNKKVTCPWYSNLVELFWEIVGWTLK